jgi:hypothetical protein
MVRRSCGRWELSQQDCGHDEGHHVAEIAPDQGPAAAGAVNEEDGTELSYQGDNAVDALIFQSIVPRYPQKSINLNREVPADASKPVSKQPEGEGKERQRESGGATSCFEY